MSVIEFSYKNDNSHIVIKDLKTGELMKYDHVPSDWVSQMVRDIEGEVQ